MNRSAASVWTITQEAMLRRLISAVTAAAAHAAPPIITSQNCSSPDNEFGCSMTYQADGPVCLTWWIDHFAFKGIAAQDTTSMAVVRNNPGEMTHFQLGSGNGVDDLGSVEGSAAVPHRRLSKEFS